MDHNIAPFTSRVTSRNHRHAQYPRTRRVLGREPDPYEQVEEHTNGPLLIREHKRRTIMSNSHRRFHRRAPQASAKVLIVNVEVIVTLDTAGNVVGQATVTQPASNASNESTQALSVTDSSHVSATSTSAGPSAPNAVAAAVSTPQIPSAASLPSDTQPIDPSTLGDSSQASVPSAPVEPTVAVVLALPSVPSVPAVPSVSFPSVPSVPPFPSTLTVPAYPFASSSVDAVNTNAVSAAASSSASVAASSSPSIVAALTAAESTASTISSIFSSTSSIASSVLASSSTLPSTVSGSTYSSPSGAATSQSAEASPSGLSRSEASSATSASSSYANPTESLDAAGSSSFYGGGGPGWMGGSATATAGSPTGTTAAISDDEAEGTGPLDTPQVVGSVVGSLAGAALILAIILILLRRHKRRRQNGGALQLTDSHPTDNEQAMRQTQAPAPARASLVPSAFLNRFSGLSRSTADTSSPTERSFQRVSGRKLPSAFSEGMTSDQFTQSGTMSGASFYQDDHGTYGSPGGLNKEHGGGFGKEIGETSFAGGAGTMNLRPGPARTPVIRHPDENPFSDTNRSNLSPPMSPNPFTSPSPDLSPRAALGRSLHSADGSRSSRFTENV
ncbi:hypothetical protein EJ07DRAFT_177069 [Lizonia empirigonia]|nr:hypothetical protein EJ07DRAFT_177069 [Lizonia empirigonia]